MRRLRHVAAHRDIRLVVGDLLVVDVDPEMVELVLIACSRALRFAPDSDITVMAKPRGSGCEIRVVDHGPGSTPADRERSSRVPCA